MSPPSFQDSDENKRWLRQKGCVKEYNDFFDDATSELELPEKYLVITYVAGLKEIADSIHFFRPRTMHQAKSQALMPEITIAKMAEKARKALEEQEEGLATLGKDESCSTNTQEKATKIPYTPMQEASLIQEDCNGDFKKGQDSLIGY